MHRRLIGSLAIRAWGLRLDDREFDTRPPRLVLEVSSGMSVTHAYAMSHATAEACTQRLAAERGHGYRLAACE